MTVHLGIISRAEWEGDTGAPFEPRAGGERSVGVGDERGSQVNVLSTYRKFFSSERDSRRLCSSRELASQRFTLGQAGKVQAYSRGFQAEHTSGINIGMGRPREGKGPTKELPMGQDSPLPPWGSPNWPNERSRNAGVSMAPGSVHPHPVLANLLTCGLKQALGSTRELRASGSLCGTDLSGRSRAHASISCLARRFWWVPRSQASLEVEGSSP